MQALDVAANGDKPVVANLIAPGGATTLQWVQAVGTIVVAVIAAGIAGSIQWRQMQIARKAAETAQNKLKLDLFERRFAVYQASAQLIVYMSDEKTHDNDTVKGLLAKLGGAEFLFDDAVHRYLTDQLMNHIASSMYMQAKRVTARDTHDAAAFEGLTKALKVEVEWFDKQFDVLRSHMRPFLLLTH